MKVLRLPFIILTMIVGINAYLHMNAAVGCLDNSWHLKKYPDNKEYHEVECLCPCWKYKTNADRNQCTRCLHYHIDTPVAADIQKNEAPSIIESASEKCCITYNNVNPKPIGRIIIKNKSSN